MENDKENKISLVLQIFIDELTAGYGMSEDEKINIEEMAREEPTKLYNQSHQ